MINITVIVTHGNVIKTEKPLIKTKVQLFKMYVMSCVMSCNILMIMIICHVCHIISCHVVPCLLHWSRDSG